MAGTKGSGRRTRAHEINVAKYYEQLLPKVFSIVREKLESEKKEDQKWAIEWLKVGLAKMIPQKIGGDPDNRTPIPLLNVLHSNNGSQENSPASKENLGTSGGK